MSIMIMLALIQGLQLKRFVLAKSFYEKCKQTQGFHHSAELYCLR